jgi:phage anti-repressor protein
MNELIKVVEKDGKQAVSARDLHEALEVGRDFSNWIKDRIEKYGFVEGEDYSPNLANRSDGLPGKPRIDYLLSAGMAKEIAIVENNEKGREVRRYLIKLEEAWNSPEMVVQRAIQLTKDCLNVYAEHYEAASKKVYNVVIKSCKSIKYLEEMDKECAQEIRELCFLPRKFEKDYSILYMHCLDAHQKLFRTCKRLGISPKDVPTWTTWMSQGTEWPDFLEVQLPESLMAYCRYDHDTLIGAEYTALQEKYTCKTRPKGPNLTDDEVSNLTAVEVRNLKTLYEDM